MSLAHKTTISGLFTIKATLEVEPSSAVWRLTIWNAQNVVEAEKLTSSIYRKSSEMWADHRLPTIFACSRYRLINSSKTEFLLIGLSKQLAKIHNSSLNTIHSARNLGFIFWPDLILSSNPVITMFVSSAVSVHTSIPKQPPQSPLPLFTPSSTTATLYRNLPKSQITLTLRLEVCMGKGEDWDPMGPMGFPWEWE